MKFLNNTTITDPAVNLALEETLFRSLPQHESCFLLWQNDNAVIIGRNQDARAEVNEQKAAELGVRIVRRMTGGGAVYHDLGNLNFSFITDRTDDTGMRFFTEPVIQTLKKLGVPAENNGRNDITAGGLKISGNAQFVNGHRVLHHGTLLFNANLNRVGDLLNVHPSKLKARGVPSVRARVGNIKPMLTNEAITLSQFREALISDMPERTPLYLSTECLRQIQTLAETKYRSDAWNFGRTLRSTLQGDTRFPGGLVQVGLNMDGDTITELVIQGDFFGERPAEELAERLKGQPVSQIKEIIAALDLNLYLKDIPKEGFTALIAQTAKKRSSFGQ